MGITAFYGAPMEESSGVQLLKDVFAEGEPCWLSRHGL